MALQTIQPDARAGTLLVFNAVTASDTVNPGQADRVLLYVKNGSGSSINVTILDPGFTPSNNTSVGNVVAVPAGSERIIGFVPGDVNPATGLITVTFSATATITAAYIAT